MNDKFCRICWNTNGWRNPSGAVSESGQSFAAQYGFGMEEWLFNYEWCIDGFKYGYLTPINRFRPTYEGKRFSAALYAKHAGLTLLVAEISNVYVPRFHKLTTAFNEMKKRGWIDQMREDVCHVAGEIPGALRALEEMALSRPDQSINIRFDPNDVTIHDPMPLIDGNNMTRYHPYNWDGSQVPVINDEEETNDPDDSTRSEKQRKRAAQQATTVDPQHVRLQNRLYDSLCTRHGNDAVRYEQDYVDLQVVGQDGCTFHETKTDSSAKKCIRNALGQLLEYSSYPAEQRARKLVVVGDAPTTKYDRAYLKHLRKRYSPPIHYARFNWEGEDMGPEE